MEQNPFIIENEALFRQRPELLQILMAFRWEMQQAQRSASEVILDDQDLQNLLKVSKRTTANYRAQRLLPYSYLGGKVFYILQDVLGAIERNKIPALYSQVRIGGLPGSPKPSRPRK